MILFFSPGVRLFVAKMMLFFSPGLRPGDFSIVTPEKNVEKIKKICQELKLHHVKVLVAKKANKRWQMIAGIQDSHYRHNGLFADDDVFWLPTFFDIYSCSI